FNAGQFDAAGETLGKEPALGSSFPEVQYLLGSLALRKGNTAEAEDHYKKSISVDKSFIPARVALANGYILRGKIDDAQEEVRQILALEPGNMNARLIQATIDEMQKNYPKAEAELSGLVKEFPDSPDVHRQMGLHLAVRGKSAEAEKSLSRA